MSVICKGDKVLVVEETTAVVSTRHRVSTGPYKGRTIVGGSPDGREAGEDALGVVFLSPNLIVRDTKVGCRWILTSDIGRRVPVKRCTKCDELKPNDFRHFSTKCVGERRAVKLTADVCLDCSSGQFHETLSENWRFRV